MQCVYLSWSRILKYWGLFNAIPILVDVLSWYTYFYTNSPEECQKTIYSQNKLEKMIKHVYVMYFN